MTVATGTACRNVFAQGGDDVITLNAGLGVPQDVRGDDGNDTIDIQVAGYCAGLCCWGAAEVEVVAVPGAA